MLLYFPWIRENYLYQTDRAVSYYAAQFRIVCSVGTRDVLSTEEFVLLAKEPILLMEYVALSWVKGYSQDQIYLQTPFLSDAFLQLLLWAVLFAEV